MTETPSTAAKTLKIVLWIVLGGAALCALCCGGVFFFSKEAREGVAIAWRMVGFAQALQQRYGAGTQISHTMRSDESGRESVFAVGIPGFDPAKAAEEQDAVWKLFAEHFRDGAPEVTHVAVGVPAAGASKVEWKPEHRVTVEEVVRRTGIAAPPTVLFEKGDAESGRDAPPPEAPK